MSEPTSYILDFEDKSTDYRQFVRTLNDAIRTHSPQATFEAGAGVGKYIFSVGLLALSLVALIVVVVVTQGDGWSEITWTKFWLVLPLLPLGVIWIKRNRPRTYDPKALPGELLPAA